MAAIPLKIFNVKQTEAISTATYFDFLDKEKCEKIVADFVTDKPITAMIDGDVVDPYRETLIHPIPMDEKSQWLYDDIADRVARYNQFGFDFDISGLYGDLQLLEYPVGGHYDWHIDTGPGEAAHRKLSVIIQLSDPEDYEGGEVLFKASAKEHELPKEQGKLAVFPSYILHKVNEVTEGRRFALATWALSHRRFR